MEDIQKLYELYSVDVYKFILSLSKDTYIAEDVMQSTFLSAIKSIDTFKGNSSVKTWLIGIAKNEYYTYRRKNPLNNSLEDIGANNFIFKQDYNDKVIDLYNCGINTDTLHLYTLEGVIHPNASGMNLIKNKMIKDLKKYYK